MSSKTRLAVCSLAAALAAVAVSCVNIDYDGESRNPKAKRSEIRVYLEKSKIECKNYKVLGTAVASAPSTYNSSEVESKLMDFAKEHGADGILLLSVDRVEDGKARRDQVLGVEPIGGTHVKEETFSVTVKALLLEFPKEPTMVPAVQDATVQRQ